MLFYLFVLPLAGLAAEAGLARALRVPLRLGHAAPVKAAPAWRRWLTGLASPIVVHVLVAVLFLVWATRPSTVPTTVVTPIPTHPAARAGVRAGDRVTAVAGQPVKTWAAVREAVGTHPGPIDLTVERQGRKVTLHVPREGTRPVGVAPQFAATGPPPGHLLRAATILPFITGVHMWRKWIRGLPGTLGIGEADGSLGGPVGRRLGATRRFWTLGWHCVSAATALPFALPVALVLGLLVVRRPRTAPGA